MLERPLGRRPSLGDVWHFVGGPSREQMVKKVADRILHRGGGRFFISGYSGVGKSLFIKQAIDELQLRLAAQGLEDRFVFRIDLTGYNLDNVQVIGRNLMLQLNWEVERSGLRLSRMARSRLLGAVQGATAKSVERVRARTDKVEPKIEVSGPVKLGLGGSKEEHDEQRTVYDGFDLPTTLLELGNLIRDIPRSVSREPSGWLGALLGSRARMPHPVMVVTIDRISSWDVLPQLADIFTAPDVTFFVVVPLEVRARWLARRDQGREDLPGFQDIYVPCVWDDLEPLVKSLFDFEAVPTGPRDLPAKLAAYLAFKSNGIPRRIEDVLFEHLFTTPVGRTLTLTARDLGDVEFCAELYRIIRHREREILGDLFESIGPSALDQYRRIAIDTALQFVSKGVVRLRDYSHTVMVALEAMPQEERDRVVRRLLAVLEEEGVAAPTGGGEAVTLSATAREMVARGHTVLLRAHLPSLEPGGLAPEDVELQVPASRPDSTRMVGAPSATDAGANFLREQVTQLLIEATRGQYDILGVVGYGGMSVVYRARETRLDRDVAIKVLPPSFTMEAAAMDRFRQEAKTAASLTHPNIVPIYAIGESGPIVWYSMMFLDGPSLEQVIDKDAPLTVGKTGAILAPVASALAYAHARGIVHRDIKPGNIVRAISGQYLVTDFGIAKALQTPRNLTGTGMAIGTPRYMAPEQGAGGSLSPATDQYALAVVAFEMLTHRVPFGGEDAMEVIYQHLQVPPPPPSRWNAAIPAAADRAIQRALAKVPGDRFGTVEEFVAALTAA